MQLKSNKGVNYYDALLYSFEAQRDINYPDGSKRQRTNCNMAIALIELTKNPNEEKEIMDNFKGGLTSSLSHELCTPINSILNLLKMMPPYIVKGSQDDLRSIILSNVEFLNSKLHDLIDYTQIELKTFQVTDSSMSVDELFQELEDIFKFETEKKGNRLILQVKNQKSMADFRQKQNKANTN